VNGNPGKVSQRYLGSAEEIEARLAGACPGEPHRSRHLSFGDLAAVRDVLDRLGVVDIIDEVVGPGRVNAGASVGTYIALATLNRIVAPRSKLAVSEWWDKIADDRLVRLPFASRDHRRFWDAMDAISPEQLTQIEWRIGAKTVTELAERLGRGKTQKDPAGVEAEIASIIRARWVPRVITTTPAGSGPRTSPSPWPPTRKPASNSRTSPSDATNTHRNADVGATPTPSKHRL
jgi:hypothetical protein